MRRKEQLEGQLEHLKKSSRQTQAQLNAERAKLKELLSKARTHRLIVEGVELEKAVGDSLSANQIYSLVAAAKENGWKLEKEEA